MKIDTKMDLDGVKALFNRLRKAGEDLTPVMKRIGETVKTSVVRNFLEGGRPEMDPPQPEDAQEEEEQGTGSHGGDPPHEFCELESNSQKRRGRDK